MRVALLISGYLRTFTENIPSIKEKIIDKFDLVDVYLHITKNETTNDKYFNPDSENMDYIIQVINPKVIIFEENQKYNNNKKINDLFNLWGKYHKLNSIKCLNEKIDGDYDLVIKYRPDVNLVSDDIFNQEISDDFVFIPSNSLIDKSKLLKDDDKYICDIIAFGSSYIMNKYFEIYSNIDNLVKKYGYISETVLHHYLNDFIIKYKEIDIDYTILLSKCNIFAIAGDSGSGKTTLGNILKSYFSNSFMLECDRYHKWERKDENWKTYTHLNPDANYITKMNEDIFNLKVGNSIYQVDYDHNSGKFTEPEKIETSDNMIVCGLHSLYNENQNLYNIKIFIDTDEKLKYTWKIKRDIQKRGYTKEQILNQIEYRKGDYNTYILPQRDKSDVIINFFTDGEFDVDKLEDPFDIKLRIYIRKKFNNIMSILESFTLNQIKYDFEVNDEHYVIVFPEFTDHNLNLNRVNKNFYDYILYTILNIKD